MINLLGTITAALDDSDTPSGQYESYAIEPGSLDTSFTRQEPTSPQSEFARTVADTSTIPLECDGDAIVPGSIRSDMGFIYHYPELTIGVIADNHWSGHCTAYDRSTSFKITSLAKVTEFMLAHVSFDDYLWIKVNGNTVYVGPDGGDSVEVMQLQFGMIGRNAAVRNGAMISSCERATHWDIPTNIDLKPYLREGQNKIWTRVIVAGHGEGRMKIIARQEC